MNGKGDVSSYIEVEGEDRTDIEVVNEERQYIVMMNTKNVETLPVCLDVNLNKKKVKIK
jgi:hypothetical protein